LPAVWREPQWLDQGIRVDRMGTTVVTRGAVEYAIF
jgi:hypothetical protein